MSVLQPLALPRSAIYIMINFKWLSCYPVSLTRKDLKWEFSLLGKENIKILNNIHSHNQGSEKLNVTASKKNQVKAAQKDRKLEKKTNLNGDNSA